ncbi:AAA family ATPase [Butyricimonas paravirosa]|uniref:AAA family ATPase n=1 Tax=Butyricimonas paravirosa TaxID=1472417 RepID=UPI0021096460|nr:AAA family ATPase [Butyricimonas paravirosa]MCQ4875073.1 AAA family ATPase [Butyricimonas paravirosa]
MEKKGKYNFIQLKQVTIRNFSLYKKEGEIYEVNETINAGVFCLAGANGLGKTTFLNALNFGLTGIVLAPGREVFEPSDIKASNKKYTERYFIGRIKDSEKDKAIIEILFHISGVYFKICRNFFEPDGLRSLDIFVKDNGNVKELVDTENKSPKQLNEIYQKELARTMGIKNFEYFVFLQLYVFTFDENRRMIFWDDRASSHALAIAFNTDIKDSEELIATQREMERMDSYGRNYRWQATQIEKKIKDLLAKQKEYPDIEKQQKEYDKINLELDEAAKIYENTKIEYNTLLKNLSILHSEIMYKKQDRAKMFSIYSEPRAKLLHNPYISLSIEKKECCICGSKGDFIVESIESNLYKDCCPLCNTKIDEGQSEEQGRLIKAIEQNDKEITSKTKETDVLTKEIEWKKVQLEKAEYEYGRLKDLLNSLLELNPLLSKNSTGNQGVDFLIEVYRKECEENKILSKKSYQDRDKFAVKLQSLQDKIEATYSDAESTFVPIFQNLAKSFIGMDLDIKLQREKHVQKLVLELQNSARTDSFQLSESQRFFLDIALRMSFAIYLSTPNNSASMLIDTPEGSLDIAYENRVGRMFADFVNKYSQNILMTANINASQLLISLAELCGSDIMKFRRMLDWTDLTPIQKEGEALFEKVYVNIENALKIKVNQK